MEVGDTFEKKFSYTQEDVDLFAKVTGDYNPIHLDQDYAEKSIFGRRILHGMLSASIFSKIFGTEWPGNGTIYLKQSLQFLLPMFVEIEYTSVCEIVNVVRNNIEIKTEIFDENNNITITGIAKVKLL